MCPRPAGNRESGRDQDRYDDGRPAGRWWRSRVVTCIQGPYSTTGPDTVRLCTSDVNSRLKRHIELASDSLSRNLLLSFHTFLILYTLLTGGFLQSQLAAGGVNVGSLAFTDGCRDAAGFEDRNELSGS